MARRSSRRSFLKHTVAASTGAALAASFEERNLIAYAAENPPAAPASPNPGAAIPTANIGNLNISRLICGGNLISGYAHSRDLMYVSPLLEHYFTDKKIFETFHLCEANGINAAMLKFDEKTVRIIQQYWREEGGKIQWIAQVVNPNSPQEDTRAAVDAGAVGIFTTGQMGDELVRQNKVDLLATTIEYARDNSVIAGISCHELAVIRACEKAGIAPDFYMKTFNQKNYWSASSKTQCDNVFNNEPPEDTIAVMKDLERPWVAFKVLGAGAIDPKAGFDYAYRNGADLLCVGMFDFQVATDAVIAREVLAATKDRSRPWHG